MKPNNVKRKVDEIEKGNKSYRHREKGSPGIGAVAASGADADEAAKIHLALEWCHPEC